MRHFFLVLWSCLMGLTACAAGPGEHDLPGTWSGQIIAGQNRITVVVNFAEAADGNYTGTLETPDQVGSPVQPLENIEKDDSSLGFSVPQLSSAYSGVWSADELAWTGKWSQSGVTLPLVLRKGPPAAKPIIEGLDGTWEGAVDRGGREIRFIVRIETQLQGTNATFDSPSFGIRNVPIADLSRDGNRVRFRVPATGVEYDATLSNDGESMTGSWTLPGRPDAEVTFVRIVKAAAQDAPAQPKRPQHPTPPFGYNVEEVSFDNPAAPGVTLSGTLTVPAGDGPFPAVILITGSGPQDRDQTLYGHKPFAVIADQLTSSGIAVLRYDDRGVAGSTGDFASATSADFATDANAAVSFLLSRSDIRPDAIGLMGHSEGGVVAPLAALENDDIDFLVLLAAPGQDFVEIQLAQRRSMAALQGLPEAAVIATEPLVRAVYKAIKSADSRADAEQAVRALMTDATLAAFGAGVEQKEMLVQQLTRDWFRFLLKYDADAVLSAVDIPVLALGGSLDWQVPSTANLEGIRIALAGNADATVMELEDLNHMFQTAKTGGIQEYEQIEETFSPMALEVISDWIKDRF